ncbi:MAG: hypothetical protein HZA49_06565 [Planctomycetes bacterium]|nr:hypothetical protein [Planctomycetota bacterium]
MQVIRNLTVLIVLGCFISASGCTSMINRSSYSLRTLSTLSGAGLTVTGTKESNAVNPQSQTTSSVNKQSGTEKPGGNENQSTFALRFGDYVFYNKSNREYYGSSVGDNSLDMTFGTANPNISWRIAIDGAATESDELFFGGFSGSVVFHTSRAEMVRWFGGLGLGSYSAEEYGVDNYGYSVLYEGRGIGYKAFGGVEVALSSGFALSMELALRELTARMAASNASTTNVSYSGQALLFGLNFSF